MRGLILRTYDVSVFLVFFMRTAGKGKINCTEQGLNIGRRPVSRGARGVTRRAPGGRPEAKNLVILALMYAQIKFKKKN